MKAAVLGLGFGDEGKGMAVSTLCQQYPSLVIRFCGGHQAGHRVMLKDGKDHVFSNFGSGTFFGCPTYWSKYCTFHPPGVLNEWNILTAKGVKPTLYVDKECPVTTFADIWRNRLMDRRNGTCGVGVGTTLQREQDHYSLKVGDLLNRTVLKIKLELILDQYYLEQSRTEKDKVAFLSACKDVLDIIKVVDGIPYSCENYVFEGSQGILLDQNIGFFPHVTRSNTGLKNIMESMSDTFRPHQLNSQVIFVTRAYQTRHGEGPMTNLNAFPEVSLVNPYEHNTLGPYQGPFRVSVLDLDLLKYAIDSQSVYQKPDHRTLLITCMDSDVRILSHRGVMLRYPSEEKFIRKISDVLGISRVAVSRDPYPGWDVIFEGR